MADAAIVNSAKWIFNHKEDFMERFLVEVTIVQEIKATSKSDAEKKGLLKIPKVIFDHLKTNVEVSYMGA